VVTRRRNKSACLSHKRKRYTPDGVRLRSRLRWSVRKCVSPSATGRCWLSGTAAIATSDRNVIVVVRLLGIVPQASQCYRKSQLDSGALALNLAVNSLALSHSWHSTRRDPMALCHC